MKPRRTARKSGKKPAPPGSFCANCISTKGPLYMELGWNDDLVPVAICEACSTQEGGGTERVSQIIGRKHRRDAA